MESKWTKSLKRKAAVILMLAAMVLNMLASMPQNALAATPKTFDFLEITDLHGTLNPVGSTQPVAATLAKQIKDIKAANPNSVILSGGDMFQGSALSNILKGQPVIEMMKNIGFDAVALGNHEYDWGINTVIDPQNADIKGTSIPVLAANVYDKTTEKPVNYTKPDVMLDKDGVKIGVIGVVDNKEFSAAILPALIKDVDFKDPVPIINQLAKDLKSQGAQIVVVLAHMGASADQSGAVSGNLIDMAQQLSGVDAIFGGHTHTMLTTKVKGIPVGVANAYGKGYIHLKVTLNADGTVSTGDMNYQDDVPLYKAQTPSVDPDVQAIVAKATQEVGPTLNEVLGTAAVELTRTQSTTPYGDSIIGNWTSQATKDAVQADFAFTNNGALRCDLPKGDIKVGDMWALMPFDDTIYTMKMTGAQIKAVLEDGVQDGGKGIQVAGLSFTYDPAKPTMNRVTSLKKSDGTPIELTQTYTVATNDFMGTGGDRFTGFNDPAIVDKKDTGVLLRDVFIEAAKAQKTMTGEIDNRILATTVKVTGLPTSDLQAVPSESNSKLQVTASWLNLRTGPGLDCAVARSIPRGTVVNLLGVSGAWDRITYNGNTYYVYAKYVQPATETAVLKSVKVIARIGLNVRDGASLSSNILGALPYGSVVEVLGVSGDWYKIIYNGSYSYVYAKYAK
ncbi:5'-nucleotidase/2',3'-cyclic phosphodiesterase-like hydrolase [Desulfosporosinus orientis DSM 765]|uniref:5'-nucleotidase/2',3'-cyclic phosphodiesterase-like hydrolase n=1 Tax=Desulfosporosinus orientis (strain ATCC 19365 / DSM 765 / NCIMB 8382 / VKM B-1628 / Singapore I) TaxID=768706 RepID=G7W6U1_DESOD|nr:5'-nucleotidase C-terminal domain-containing protein [Desulfosporosinus orientis]AET69223.1 5'-nucleotidase/2',3'-cyclic phosphodiesterase-like hydrolase [Desulfosporosinus orientis DSM 765]